MDIKREQKMQLGYWIIAVVALVWNLMGCAFLSMEIFAQEAMMKSMTEDQKAWARSIPRWIYFVYAVAVSTGVAGSIGLFLRKDWTITLFAICLVAVLVQMGYTMVIAGGLRVMGPSGAVMPSVVVVIAVALLGFSWFASSRNWFAEVGPTIGPG